MFPESPKKIELQNFEKKILIVDDEVFNIDALMIILGMVLKIDVDMVCDKATSGDVAL